MSADVFHSVRIALIHFRDADSAAADFVNLETKSSCLSHNFDS